MKEVVSQEGHEQKTFDSAWIMLEVVIRVPFVGQLVETIILDILSTPSGGRKTQKVIRIALAYKLLVRLNVKARQVRNKCAAIAS